VGVTGTDVQSGGDPLPRPSRKKKINRAEKKTKRDIKSSPLLAWALEGLPGKAGS